MDFEPLMNGSTGKENEDNKPLCHPCTQEEFNSVYHYINMKEPGLCKRLQSHAHCNVGKILTTVFPVLDWLPKYNWKRDIISDIISGFTVAVMHIPQGMAYSSLAGVPPIVGIYMAFFPVLVYFFFGSSRHVSMGTFAVICMMTGKPVLLYSTSPESLITNSTSSSPIQSQIPSYTPLQVATVVCLVVGFWQVLLGLCRLGSLSILMSETLVSGFTTGAAVLVFTSQIKHVFGIKLPTQAGPLKLIHTYVNLFGMIHQTNYLALGLTLSVVILLLLYSEIIKPKITCKSNIPVPMELIMITLGTLVSRYFHLNQKFNISVVGDIPTGLPEPTLPPLDLVPNVLVDGLVIAIVAFSINISMASLFARKENYKVDANQELIASGLGNLAGSFFSCLPFAASLSRSLIQHGVGGKTQLASVVSCSILVLVLLFIGPFFEPLPHCVLAGIILTALKGMLKQVQDFPVAWKHSRRDGIIWIVTFSSVILLDIDVGLGMGIIVSLAAIILMSQKPYVHLLGKLPNTDIYLESDRYHKAVPVPNVMIVRICGGLHFANKNNVRSKIEKLLKKEFKEPTKCEITRLVIDMSAVIFIDPASSKALLNLVHDLKSQQVTVCLAKCSGHLYEQLKKCEFFNLFPENRLFPSIQDAVSFSFPQDSTLVTELSANVKL